MLLFEFAPVEHRRDEATDQLEAVVVELRSKLCWIRREISVWTEFGCFEADLRHLRKHAIGVHQVPPTRRAVDAPGDGRSGDS